MAVEADVSVADLVRALAAGLADGVVTADERRLRPRSDVTG
jgi:hypothetical protein